LIHEKQKNPAIAASPIIHYEKEDRISIELEEKEVPVTAAYHIIQEEKESKTIVESAKHNVSSERRIVTRVRLIAAKKMTQEEETAAVIESKDRKVSTKLEQEPIVSREIHTMIPFPIAIFRMLKQVWSSSTVKEWLH
jgi:hypothetical protein